MIARLTVLLLLPASVAAQTCPQDRALALELDNRKSAVLCSGDAKQYEYERLDEAGRFHIVRTAVGDDFFYTLVLKGSGEQIEVPSTPIWATDKSRFVTVGCSLQPARGEIKIQPAGGQGPRDGSDVRAALRARKLPRALDGSRLAHRDLHAARR
ncbi:MAG TPA: hypothetical protein VEC14_13485 [Reyranellaceae bacterium]|nr:hypothetical protein [Reyranellaceae bacterium]